MKIHPINENYLVKVDAAESTTPGGLVIPDNARSASVTGVVVASCDSQPSVGERVLFKRGSGLPVKHEGEEYLMLKYEHILATIE